MSNQPCAVLMEAVSIQQYIFSSNKLKENIGASYILEKLLYGKKGLVDNILRDKDFFGESFNIDQWKEAEAFGLHPKGEVGYIGGGNALIFFANNDKAKDFIKRFSRDCLLLYPSLRMSFGVKDAFNVVDYKSEYQKLLQDLKGNRSKYIPIVSIPKHGITADCPWSNETAEAYEMKNKNFISCSTQSKLQATKEAQSKQEETYQCLGGKYTLTDEVEYLGQGKEASYVSIVHIDGNGMGKIFSQIDSIEELRKKSKSVSAKANSAMNLLIEHIIKIKEQRKIDELSLNDENRKTILPIRPILVGGDDVTFLCEGRLGMYLAEKFIELFYDETERSKGNNSPEKIMDGACAGVAIVKSHFPFYKAVKLAEELCSEAKRISRANGGSSISYYYSSSTFSGSLEDLRKKTHEAQSGNMYYGPYKLFEEHDAHSIENLKMGIKHFKEQWPKNKVMRLRDIIADLESTQKLFEKEIEEIGLKLPQSKATVWESKQTAYFDQIELMDFYLDTLL